ncbi:methyltransferase-like protein 7B [Cricetulus griseus]|uniref:Methyltransferase-like protein 7B n=1 Tax=Cricetulus griseus TaxID=10029 RepID=G3HRM2_CRIGR|nr:methyltransferase-like protein 7B [Cricetulus griseus]XP_027247914.1 methyltransferase-like protein 7B [Cricetulus griseus]EGW12540.1 Methyltransferase-like protein 7B [Cricetulus griseus]ERE91695.1 methyltransferase-like protein 7B-like protein [Cricetulus griseus]
MGVLVPFLQLLVLLLTLPLHLLALVGFWQPVCKTYFPYLMAKLTERANKKMESKKRELFSQIKDLKGTSGKVALLELGCGTGANFQFYPPNCRVTCVDPNPNFEKFLTKSMAENKHLQYERFIVAYGEDMRQLADSSMDVVVCTLVLCSVRSPKKVLQEIQRVLKPGGLLFFWEHVAEPRGSWAFLWQQVFEPTWKHIGDGCHLTRETWKDLEKARFSDVQMERQSPPFKWLPIGPHIMGKAVK